MRQKTKQVLDLSLFQEGQNLSQFRQSGSFGPLISQVVEQKELVLTLVQPLATGVGGGFANGLGKSPGKNQPGAPATAHAFQKTIGDQTVYQRFERFGNREFSANRIQNEEMGGIVEPHFFLTDAFQVGKKGGILNNAVEGEREVVGGCGRSRELLGACDRILEDEVHALARALDHAAALEDFG